jgi:hypothetical protein
MVKLLEEVLGKMVGQFLDGLGVSVGSNGAFAISDFKLRAREIAGDKAANGWVGCLVTVAELLK